MNTSESTRSERHWAPLVDEIAMAVVLTDPSDPSAIALLREQFVALAAAITDGPFREPAQDAIAALDELLRGEARDGLAEVSAAVSRLQEPSETAAREPVRGGGQTRNAETLELLADFVHETEDGLERVDRILLSAETEGIDGEKVNALFRVFHTIKGVANALDLGAATSLAHATETLLNQARQGAAALEGDRLEAMLVAAEGMRKLLAEIRRAVESGDAIEQDAAVAPAMRRLAALLADHTPSPEPPISDLVAMGPPSSAKPSPREMVFAHEEVVTPPSPTAAVPARGKLRETLKLDVERVDSVLEMIGELVIAESMVVAAPEIAAISSPRVRTFLGQLTKISRDLQGVAMRMRMVPVRGVFQKMAKVVRDLARKTDKSVTLVQSGEATEMDRSMVDRIEDPLLHMMRNAVDHGIEPASERLAAGKPAHATVTLSAFHQGGTIIIEITDDGRGLSRPAIVAKALARGLIRDADALTDADVFGLIFLPGFSTAERITEISGRGVGMDVVKRAIEAMRGRVAVSSTPGKGTTFRLILPLTLAVIDGTLAACGGERYIVPSLSIVESLKPRADMVHTLGRGELINVRGEMIPLLRLHRLFDVPGEAREPTEGLCVIVESTGRKLGLLVDDVVAQQQVVIKPLGEGMGDTDCLSGAAILSDGRVGLILNVDRLGEITRSARSARSVMDTPSTLAGRATV